MNFSCKAINRDMQSCVGTDNSPTPNPSFILMGRKSIDLLEKEYIAFKNELDARKKKITDFRVKNETVSISNSQILRLNIGGKEINTRRQTLQAIPESKLAWLFSGRWDHLLRRDKYERIYLDIDSRWFEKILDFLRSSKFHTSNQMIKLPTIANEDKFGTETLFDFFGLNDFVTEHNAKFLFQSSIISDATSKELLMEWVNQTTPSQPSNLDLLYRGSRDGFQASKFHELCDNKGETVTIIKTTSGYVFGGYSDVAWDSSITYKQSSKSFLFSLISPQGNNPIKMSLKSTPHNHAIYCCSSQLPTFGGGHDLLIADHCNANQTNSSNLNNTYEAPSGIAIYFAGSRNFQVQEMEVFHLIRKSDIANETAESVQRAQMYPRNESCSRYNSLLDFIDEYESQLHKLKDYEKEIEVEERLIKEEVQFMHNFIRSSDEDKDEIIYFNVGGTIVCVMKDTLNQLPNSLLAKQYGARTYKPQPDELDVEGNIFLDVNPYCFEKIISYTRLKRISKTGAHFMAVVPTDQAETFMRLINYYNVNEIFEAEDNSSVNFSSDIVNITQFFASLKTWLSEARMHHLDLLYRGSRDGFQASKFHELCDNKGETVTIIKTTSGYVFGGYSDVAWDSSITYKQSSKSFLFSLISPQGNNPIKMSLKSTPHNHAIYCCSSQLPTFGGGNDILIADHCNANQTSYSNLNSTYEAPSRNTNYFVGSRNFQVQAIEVFRIIHN